MKNKNVLVVYYSRSGYTKKVAHELKRELRCDLEEITESGSRQGLLGYLKSSLEATFKSLTLISDPKRDASLYELVVIGTPVWNSSISAPIRTYLVQNKFKFNRVAFFTTQGGKLGRRRVFKQMIEICGKKPEALMAVSDRECLDGRDVEHVREFISQLSGVINLEIPQAVRGTRVGKPAAARPQAGELQPQRI